jgi:hypothetical protein
MFEDNIKLNDLFKTDQSMIRHLGFGDNQKEGYLADLMNLIAMYAPRSLTNNMDALDAFRRVLARCHFHTYWGIPFIDCTEYFYFKRTQMLPADFCDPGNVTAGFLAGLARTPTTRITKHKNMYA